MQKTIFKEAYNTVNDDMETFRKYKQTMLFDGEKNLVGSDLQIRNDLALKNARLVRYVVKKFYNHVAYKKIEEDLMQEGFFGLFTAIDKFDPERGYKFSTYAVHWILQACSGYLLEHMPHLHIPSHVKTAQNKLLKYMKNNEVRMEDVKKDVLESLGISEKMMKCICASMSSQFVASLNEPGTDGKPNIHESTLESQEPCAEDKMDSTIIVNAAKKALMSLGKRERLLILLRYNILNT
jgi:RNA polymerase primary sigma factor